ncbi:MAG: hypothetical protein KDJ99_32010 [Candidatus Competibacteraceae bacterium]|nr:hypothetical protein [Candidatus Competibacteraceae bacterium]
MSSTEARRITAAERRAQALDLRLAGYSFEAIGQQLGISKQAAYKHVSTALETLHTQTDNSAEQLRALELERLDALLKGCWTAATAGDSESTRVALKVLERRAKLLGLDVSTRTSEGDGEDPRGYIVVVPPKAASIEEWAAKYSPKTDSVSE